MNIPRKIAVLKRNIQHRKTELTRIGKLREMKYPAILAFPRQVHDYLEKITTEMVRLESELKVLEQNRELR